MYRYSRGQPGQGSLPRPAWGSGSGSAPSHGARTASPEPGGIAGSIAGTSLGGGGTIEQPKVAPQDEVEMQKAVLQLENELAELRNACSVKDQRIAELSRTDTPAARLKRDIRHLASELHHTRKELKESMRELQDLRSQLDRKEGGTVAQRDTIDSTTGASTTSGGHGNNASGRGAGGDRGSQLRGRIVELEEENRTLRDSVVQLKAQGLADTLHQSHVRQPSGASTQRVAEPPPSSSSLGASVPGTDPAGTAGASAGPRQSYMNQQTAASQATSPSTVAPSTPSAGTSSSATAQEVLSPLVYSSQNTELGTTIGPTTLQGVGTVDGVHMVAKVLLQRIQSSVCAAHRRAPAMAATLGAPGVPQQMMVQMPLT